MRRAKGLAGTGGLSGVRHSIRHRFMLVFAGLMAAMIFTVWAVNNWWLEPYYINQKLRVLEEAYEAVDAVVMDKIRAGEEIGDVITSEVEKERELYDQIPKNVGKYGRDSGGEEDADAVTEETADGEEAAADAGSSVLLDTIRAYGEENNITTVLIDSSTGKALISADWESELLARKVQRYVLGLGEQKTKLLKEHENYVVETNFDLRTDSSYIESWGFFSDNSTLFIMSMPLASIRESTALSNQFTTYVGLSVLVLGIFVMYIVTNQVTKPILKLAAISERMSNLDFDASYEDNAQDEIGALGRSMNLLSDRLQVAIGQLREANAQLTHDIEVKTQIDEMRQEFIANVSHELKTPIALIQGYAEGLSAGLCEDEESRNYYCEVITDEAVKMNRMVRQLLALSALEYGNDVAEMKIFDVTELIGSLLNSSRILLEKKEAVVVTEMPESLLVIGDEFKIEEVLTNYLSNAMNHLAGERIIRLRAGLTDGRVIVRVYNSGQHIPEADLGNLWTKFYKVDKARSRDYGGSGIGLSIVKAVMDAHGQECGVSNEPGGVEFWFSLEAADLKNSGSGL